MNGTPVGENTSASAASTVVRPGRPIVTYAVIGLCLLIFVWASADRVGMFLHLVQPIHDLPSGWWALFSTALVHIEVTHLVFNMVAFLALGQIVELTAGKIRFVILLLLVAWMASFSQLFFERAFGIGLSGVVYGVFGFMLGAAPVNRFYLWFVRKNAAMLVGWAILCVILTQFKLLNIANAAHFGGLIFGALCGLYYGLPRLRWVFATLVLGILGWSCLVVFGP
jgi:membrane associated rhomboid family serine protease